MALPTRHIRSQGPVIASLGATALSALRRRLRPGRTPAPVQVPGPELHATLPPRPRALVHDYVRFCGGDPSSYRHTLPPHLWPQWGFPLAAKTLADIPYPLFRVLNAGCRLEVNAPLAIGEPLEISARLIKIDENERRAVLEQRVVTSTAAAPEALVATLFALVPLAQPAAAGAAPPPKARAERERIPLDVQELRRWTLAEDAGLAYAMLSGDFNPVHWLPPYARAFGFGGPILQGFATMAMTWEALLRGRFGGESAKLRGLDLQFTKPLLLPAELGLYLRPGHARDEFWVGAAPGGAAYLKGTTR